jgi:hypothetical protein
LATALQFTDQVTVESPREIASVRRMAGFFFASFWTIIFTGAIRKWMFPGVSIFYLLQDVPIGLAYMYALWSGFFSRNYLMLCTLVLGGVLTLQALAQIVISGLDVVVAVVGLHNYLFYLPMLFIFPLCLTVKYRKDFVRWNLLLSIPMFVLAVAQELLPKQSFINRTSEGETAFGLPGAEVARVSGTFNFTAFYAIWVGMAVALCMGEWLLPKERRTIKNLWLLILCTFAVNLCHLLSASRSAIIFSTLAILGAMLAAVVLGSNRAILAIAGICVMVPVAAGMTYIISPEEFNVVQERFTSDRNVDEGTTRVEGNLIGFITIPKFSLIGAGIGMGVDAAHLGNADTYNFTYELAENDMTRTVMEAGTPVGLLYAFTRFSFLLGMIFFSIRLVRAGSSPHVLPLSFFLFAQGYQGDLTRAATMTASQEMIGYAFILGAYYYPDNASAEAAADDFVTRSV